MALWILDFRVALDSRDDHFGHIVAKPADIDELLCAAVLSVFRSCKHNE